MPNIINIIITVAVGLTVAGLVAWFKTTRLAVLYSKSFTHSHLTSKGRLIELIVFNKGFQTEELIEISLSQNLQYELVASSQDDVNLHGNKLSIPRIVPNKEISILLLTEGGTFTLGDISSCLSKNSTGTIHSKLTEVPVSGSERIGLSVFIGIFALICYWFYASNLEPSSSTDSTSKVTPASPLAKKPFEASHPPKNKKLIIQNWNIPSAYEVVFSDLFQDFKDNKFQIDVKPIANSKGIITLQIIFKNATLNTLKYNIEANTSRSYQKFQSYELSIRDEYVPANSVSKKILKVYVPEELTYIADRTVYLEAFVQSTDGDSLKMTSQKIIE